MKTCETCFWSRPLRNKEHIVTVKEWNGADRLDCTWYLHNPVPRSLTVYPKAFMDSTTEHCQCWQVKEKNG